MCIVVMWPWDNHSVSIIGAHQKNNVESDYGKSTWHMQPMIKIVQLVTKMATKIIQNGYNLVDVARFFLTNDENKMPLHP